MSEKYFTDTQFVPEMITQKAEQVKGESSISAQSLAEEIISELPPELDRKQLDAWCEQKVAVAVKKYPKLKRQAVKARREIQREILYRIYLPAFQKVGAWAANDTVKVFSPNDIFKTFPAEHDIFRNNFRTKPDGIDWDYIIQKLGVTKKFTYIEQKDRTRESAIKELVKLLELKKPKEFSPKWLIENDLGLYEYIQEEFRSETGIDWPGITVLLPDEWRVKWKPKRHSLEELRKGHSDLVEKLEELTPDEFGPGWIYHNVPWVYFYYQRKVRNAEGVDWSQLLKELPEKWKFRWNYHRKIPIEI